MEEQHGFDDPLAEVPPIVPATEVCQLVEADSEPFLGAEPRDQFLREQNRRLCQSGEHRQRNLPGDTHIEPSPGVFGSEAVRAVRDGLILQRPRVGPGRRTGQGGALNTERAYGRGLSLRQGTFAVWQPGSTPVWQPASTSLDDCGRMSS